MKWFGWLRRKFDPPPVTRQETAQLQGQSDRDGIRARSRDEEVREVARNLLQQRQQNHFGPLIWAALRGEAEPDV